MKDESRLIFLSKNQKKYKEFKISRGKLILYISVFLIAFLVSGKLVLDTMVNFSLNSKILQLERTNTILKVRLTDIKDKIERINNDLGLVASKDDELRKVLGLEALSSDIREVGIGGSPYDYSNDEVSGFDEGVEISIRLTQLAKLEREVKLELKSYQNLLTTFSSKQDSLAHLPALRPILKGVISSGFGSRNHPLLRVKRHHEGIDISARRGTPIYATAEGIVNYAGRMGGYGNMVIINHKYGFETRYGHMNKFTVRKGQKISRGDKIGEVGNTGLSTAPHLHYEVRFNGKPLNPRSYWFDDKILNEQVVARK